MAQFILLVVIERVKNSLELRKFCSRCSSKNGKRGVFNLFFSVLGLCTVRYSHSFLGATEESSQFTNVWLDTDAVLRHVQLLEKHFVICFQ